MALTYVGGTSGGGTGASYTVSLNATLTGGSNSSPSVGDLILVFVGEANGASVTSSCSGNTAGAYSTIRAHQNVADTHDANLDSFYKFAGATPDTTLTITRGNNNTTYGSATVVHVWRGADSANPFNVTPTIASSANGSAANPAAITPTTAGSVVLYCRPCLAVGRQRHGIYHRRHVPDQPEDGRQHRRLNRHGVALHRLDQRRL